MEKLTRNIYEALCDIEDLIAPLYASGELTESDTIVANNSEVKVVIDKCCYTFGKARNFDGFAIRPTEED